MSSSDVRLSDTSAQNARVKLSKSSCVQIFTVSYFAVLIFAFWSWVAKIAKIWTSQKFPAIRYSVSYLCLVQVVFHVYCVNLVKPKLAWSASLVKQTNINIYLASLQVTGGEMLFNPASNEPDNQDYFYLVVGQTYHVSWQYH